ncbi:MAG: COX15/CtaA family protein [Pseudomonadota bacterium]
MALQGVSSDFDHPAHSHGPLRVWLTIVALLVIAMVAVGGVTRLTDSGLSITEWQPILGAIPPLSTADWQEAFEKYKQIPEYRDVNAGMDLAGFKAIFWWEWIHRFLGRFIGLVFAVPLLLFWVRGQIPQGYHWRFVGLLLLGGLQGFIGWYMVQSGLTERVDVSQYRLALHLCTAFLILAGVVWCLLSLRPDNGEIYFSNLRRYTAVLAWLLMVLIFSQVALGAFVAGTKAGLVYTTWPLMDGAFIPEGLYPLQPWYLSAGEDHLTIQFNHRILAYVLLALSIIQVVRTWNADNDDVSRSAVWLAVLMIGQAVLGIWTLVSVDGAIPIGLGVSHQTLAAIVFATSVWHLYEVRQSTARDR